MNIPKQINQQPINEKRLIPSEIPLQPLHTNHGLLIYANAQNRWLEQPFILLLHAASDHNIVPRAGVAELSLGGVKGAPRTMLCSRQKRNLSRRQTRASEIELLRKKNRFFSGVTENQTNFRVDDDHKVKALNRFGTRFVLGVWKIPQNFDLGWVRRKGFEDFGALFLPEKARIGVESKGWRVLVVEGYGESLVGVAPTPCDRHQNLLQRWENHFVDAGNRVLGGGCDVGGRNACVVRIRRTRDWRMRHVNSVLAEASNKVSHFDQLTEISLCVNKLLFLSLSEQCGISSSHTKIWSFWRNFEVWEKKNGGYGYGCIFIFLGFVKGETERKKTLHLTWHNVSLSS